MESDILNDPNILDAIVELVSLQSTTELEINRANLEIKIKISRIVWEAYSIVLAKRGCQK